MEVVIMQLYIYNGQVTTYTITTTGELYNNKTRRWLKGQIAKNGYKTYNISIDGEKHRLYAHRMVAETYLPGADTTNEVHHKDGNKLNNAADNLEWIISKSQSAGQIGGSKTVYCFDEHKRLVAIYPSVAECSRVTHYNSKWLAEQCGRPIKTLSHGYYWSYDNDNTFQVEYRDARINYVGQYNAEGTLLETYTSIADAARKNNYDRHRISECCNGKIHTYRGYVWKFIK